VREGFAKISLPKQRNAAWPRAPLFLVAVYKSMTRKMVMDEYTPNEHSVEK
jgi:hypothetical protein